MALKKQINIKGLELEYWVIFNIVYNKILNKTTVSIKAFKDQATRQQSLKNFMNDSTKSFTYSGIFTIQELYAKIKLEPFFVGSVDI